MKKIVFIILLSILTTSCASRKDVYKKEELAKTMLEQQQDEPAQVNIVKIKEPLPKEDTHIGELTQNVSISLKQPIPLKEFLPLVFKNHNISVVLNIDDQFKNLQIHIPYYNGALSDLLTKLSETYGIFFKYNNNVVTTLPKEAFYLHIDNYPKVSEMLVTSLKTLGAENVAYDAIFNKIFFVADYKAYAKVRAYVNEIKDNLAIITFHLIVGEVELHNDYKTGVDWERLAMAYVSPFSLLRNSSTTTTGNTTGSSGVKVGGVAIGEKKGGLEFNAGVANLNISLSNFGLSSFVNLMEKYGKFKTIQNTYITLQSGYKGKIDASKKTPYVKQVGVGVIGAGTATQTAQTVDFAEAESGTIIDITPIYNNSTELLSIDIDGKIQSINSFINLSTGTITVSRPILSVRNIKTQVILQPDTVAILGGLISESINNASSGLPGIATSWLLGSQSDEKRNSELVIIIKPQITRFVAGL